MDKDFRQELILAALNGFASNSFLAQQLAALEDRCMGQVEINSAELIANLSIKAADEVLKKIASTK